ncbi:uncharacterized protein LOC108114042 [Drosophila eugracilis]|uniref:uncharacterized protein LOC108114042 n=1 Tax=Drosophila eugracilis TaxID=29029 RepID=UPI0007E7C4AF|nr:uncharacterized protein LOC108114042 [Drosophila eugracilis]
MFKPKIRDIGYFGLLTYLHLCSNLQPEVHAHANIKSAYPSVDRNLTLQFRYIFNPWMVVKAMIYSLLVMIGIWYCRHLQSTEQQKSKEINWVLKATQLLTAADVKNNWISRNKKNSELELSPFSWNIFSLFALPWILTFMGSGFINYLRLYMVIQHFCISNWRTIQLYGQLQWLFWYRLLSMAMIPCWSTIFGGGVSNLPENFINLETHLLD